MPLRLSVLRRGVFGLAALASLALGGLPAAAATSDPATFMADLGNRVLQLLTDRQQPAAERGEEFKQLADQAFDFPRIARFTLGAYWRNASDDQKQQYAVAFEVYMVKFYWSQFSGFNAADFKVTRQRDSGSNVTVVSTEIDRQTGQAPIAADWTLAKFGDDYKITDVSVSGISQLLTYRDQVTSTLGRSGGDLSALIDQLKQKAAN